MAKQEELYILDRGGQMVFYFNATPDQEDQNQSKLLTASYLTGILQFAKAASGNIISTFEMGKLNIMLRLGNLPLYYVFIVGKSEKVKKKTIEKQLSQIIESFEKKYSIEEIDKWDGNIYAFDDFIPNVKKILKVK